MYNQTGNLTTYGPAKTSRHYSLVICVKVNAPSLILTRVVRLAELDLCFAMSTWCTTDI